MKNDRLLEAKVTYIPYEDTGNFSPLVEAYVAADERLKPFYGFAPDENGIKTAIAARKDYPIDRQALVSILHKQYEGYALHSSVQDNIDSLLSEDTYTVCTAHQPNLLTGYLYFIYKIVHAIKLAQKLSRQYPERRFVPVYYMGSEDNDIEELGVFRYGSKKYHWNGGGQKGAVGRMSTEGLKPLLEELFAVMGPPGEALDELKDIIEKAYLHQPDIVHATRYLVNELFGRYGLIVIDTDESVFKKSILHIIKHDLMLQLPYSIVSQQAERLGNHFKVQAYPRPINLFYLKDGLRERIEKQGIKWKVVGTDIVWTEEQLLHELEAHPERFSPNVILRGMLQESILPNVVFIGGGAEVAYWMQLKTLFEHNNIFYPVVMLRQSMLCVPRPVQNLIKKAGIDEGLIFKPEAELLKDYVVAHTQNEWQTSKEQKEIEELINKVKMKAIQLDSTLRSSAEAVATKMKYQLQILEKKMLRAEKRKLKEELMRLSKLKEILFPNGGLQERTENFMEYYLLYGNKFLDMVMDATLPLNERFAILHLP